ncbi:MAG: hypothetical protein EBQ99_00480 [Planctomycetes bacterium]|nr:hypothetical protein [Planctomycetota bacterium]
MSSQTRGWLASPVTTWWSHRSSLNRANAASDAASAWPRSAADTCTRCTPMPDAAQARNGCSGDSAMTAAWHRSTHAPRCLARCVSSWRGRRQCRMNPHSSSKVWMAQPGSGSMSTVTRRPARSSSLARPRATCSSCAAASPTLAPHPSALKRGRHPSGRVLMLTCDVPSGTSRGSSSAAASVYRPRRASAQWGSYTRVFTRSAEKLP